MSHVPCLMSRRSGQSLIEATIAISILTVGFLGISSLLARSFFLSRVVSDEVTANYLAAEGIELAKNMIDHDVYETYANNGNFSWGRCFSQSSNRVGTTEEVELDYTTLADPVTDCQGVPAFTSPGRPLLYNPTTHLYSYNAQQGDITTTFTREILVTENGNEIIVNAIVR